MSDTEGQDRIYVQPFPEGGRVFPISRQGGTEPVWSLDGTELFFRHSDQMLAVDVETWPTFPAGQQRVLFEAPYDSFLQRSNYDVTADGEFLMIKSTEAAATAQLTVVVNWFEELTERVPLN